MKNVFVTGGIGFIGSHIVDSLLENGCQVTVFDNFSTGREEYLGQHKNNPKLRVVRGDILNLSFLTESMAGHDFVFHLA